jgi:hypothetical protein
MVMKNLTQLRDGRLMMTPSRLNFGTSTNARRLLTIISAFPRAIAIGKGSRAEKCKTSPPPTAYRATDQTVDDDNVAVCSRFFMLLLGSVIAGLFLLTPTGCVAKQ